MRSEHICVWQGLRVWYTLQADTFYIEKEKEKKMRWESEGSVLFFLLLICKCLSGQVSKLCTHMCEQRVWHSRWGKQTLTLWTFFTASFLCFFLRLLLRFVSSPFDVCMHIICIEYRYRLDEIRNTNYSNVFFYLPRCM